MNSRPGLRTSWWHGLDRWLLIAAALALAVGLLDPGVMMERALFEHVIVLDVTQSMNVTDERVDGQPVSRLAFTKKALRQSLLQLPCGSKVGWAIFTEYRALLLLAPIEVCANLSELRSTLAQIDARMAWSGGSEIAKGLHSAIGIARQMPGKAPRWFRHRAAGGAACTARYRPAFDDKPGGKSPG
jgi:mxaL protein